MAASVSMSTGLLTVRLERLQRDAQHLEHPAIEREQLEHGNQQDGGRGVGGPREPRPCAAFGRDAERRIRGDQWHRVTGEPIPAAPDQPRSQPEVGEDGQPEQQDQHDADGAQRDGSRSHRQNAAPRRGHRGRDLQLTVRDRAISEQLSGRVGRDDEETGFVKQNREQEWQQSHRGEVEGDRDGLVVAAIQ